MEAPLRAQSGVHDCVVIPIERGGNSEPYAILLLNNADRSAARAAIDSANASLAEYQRIRTWLVWPEFDFPRTPTGKPRLSVIAAWAAQVLDGRQAVDPENVGVDFRPSSSPRGAL